ncbi:tetratricopeptide repeat protein [Enterovibrio norvegicus]|uniref:tetratricopeptide repeat protein n=1 Tax=Enterovibrio norvegicus TaxID=188144 RepID=UPI000C8253AC|nr:tetratricopeptide repeat protein [Enterovibrio norvegicus]PMH62034.1 hypothetical protein BCU62_19725 [Enterovibrio norvegicus]
MMCHRTFSLSNAIRGMCLAVVLFSAPSFAAQLSQGTVLKVQKAFAFQEKEAWRDAIAVLREIETKKAYDRAYVDRMLGVLYWQTNDVNTAMRFLEKAVKSDALSDDQVRSAQRMLADLYLSNGNYKSAATLYSQLVKTAKDKTESAELWLRLAQANYQRKAWKSTLTAINKHLALTSPDTVSALSIKLGAELQLSRWKRANNTLEHLIALEPNKKVWWIQRAGNYQRLEQPENMLSTLLLAQREGIELTTSEQRTIAQLYAQKGVPEKAALVLDSLPASEQDAVTLSQSASYWQHAKEWENAISVWKKAAKADNTYRWQLAQLQLQQGLYVEALSSLNKVTSPEKKASVEMLRATAYDKLEQADNALLHAKRAYDLLPSSKSESWVNYLTQKRKMAKVSATPQVH